MDATKSTTHEQRLSGILGVGLAVILTVILTVLASTPAWDVLAGKDVTFEEALSSQTSSAFANAHVGDTVSFGAYEQDGNEDNGPEPLLWKVLACEGGRMLLLSQSGLECTTCYSRWGESWEESDLCAWLTKEFPKTAFSEEEQEYLLPLEESDADGAFYATLLTAEQVEQYLPELSSRSCVATKAALAEHPFAADENGAMGWWLKPSKDAAYFASSVRREGTILNYGGDMGRDFFCIRPAVWVSVA